MNIDDFLDKEATLFEGKAKVMATAAFEAKPDEDIDLFKRVQLVRENLIKKKLTEAASEFNTLRDKYVEMTKKQALQNRILFNELVKLNNDIIANMEVNAQETLKRVNIIKHLLSNGMDCLNKNLIDQANRLYAEIKSIYDQVPDLFLEDKRKIYSEILSFYILLSKHTYASARDDFISKRDALMASIEDAKMHLGSGDEELVKKDFEKISEMYEMLPDGFQKEKVFLHNEVLNLFSHAYLSSHTQSSSNAMQFSREKSGSGWVNKSEPPAYLEPSDDLTPPSPFPLSANELSLESQSVAGAPFEQTQQDIKDISQDRLLPLSKTRKEYTE